MRKAAYFILVSSLMAGAFLAGAWHNQRTAVSKSPQGARKILCYVDPMHPAYKSDKPGIAPDCGMQLEPVYAAGGPPAPGAEPGSSSRPPGSVSISPEMQQRMGVRVSRVERSSGTHTMRLFGRVAPDETATYRLTAGVDGWIAETSPVTTGTQVVKDQVLAAFATADLFTSVQTYLFALTATDHLISTVQTNPTSSNLKQRIERLQSLGMPPGQIEEIRRTREFPQSIKILAPAAGFVLARNVSPGQRFEKGTEWYRIADLSRVWILADVFEDDAQYLRPGARARVSLPHQRKTLSATVSEVLPQFDAATRTLKVRLEANNPGYILRPDMFVDVELSITFPPAISVPSDAVLDSGLKKTVFVESGEGFFELREVETGRRLGDRIEIAKGLAPGERIVTSGNFLLDSESRLKQAAGELEKPIKDPVCGMDLDLAQAKYKAMYGGERYAFCSGQCKQKFENSPERYLKKLATAGEP